MKYLRRGWQTVEVAGSVAGTVAVWLLSAAQVVPPRYAVYVTAAAIIGINFSRGVSKAGNLYSQFTDEGMEAFLQHIIQREHIAAPPTPAPTVIVTHPNDATAEVPPPARQRRQR